MRLASQVEAEAARWLARQDAGELDSAEEAEFRRWIDASTAHRVAFLRMKSLWTRADRLRLVAGGGLLASDLVDDRAEEEPAGLRPSWRRWRLPAGAATLAAAAAAAWLLLAGPQDYATPVGGFERIPLADGSRVELNTNTAIGVSYGRRGRRIELDRGEAFFQVARDESRPFVVEAGEFRVTAVGTAFSVRREGTGIELVVTEGVVRVDHSEGPQIGPPLLVPAGRRVELEPTGPIVTRASDAQMEAELGWRDGVLVFADRPLRELVAEFNRYNRRQLVVLDPAVGNIRVAGRFRPTNLDGLLRLLRPGFGVEAVPYGSERIVLRRAQD